MKKYRFVLLSLAIVLFFSASLVWTWLDKGALASISAILATVVAGVISMLLVFRRAPKRYLVMSLFSLLASLFLVLSGSLDRQLRSSVVMVGTLLLLANQFWLARRGSGSPDLRRKDE